MPIFDDVTMDEHDIDGSGYGFSAAALDDLESSEYTLVSLVVDISGSVSGFHREIEACVKEVINACRLSPRADNLMLRFLPFHSKLEERHGFKPLSACNPDDYTNSIHPAGMTALYDASHNAVEATVLYAKDLSDNEFDVNSIVFVITDGMDNASTQTKAGVRFALEKAVSSEAMESIVSVLIGVNVMEPEVGRYLRDYQVDAGFTQYVEIEQANQNTLAKLAQFVSKSISSQSASLGSGGASVPLTF